MSTPSESQPQQLLDHYTRLAALPGWREYVWARVKELARDCPELYGSFPALVTPALKSSAPKDSTPPVSPPRRTRSTARPSPGSSRS